MNDIIRQAKEVPVPQSRLSRSLGLGKMVASIIGNIVFDSSKELLQGRNPKLEKLLLTEQNTLRFVSELSKMRGAALKIGQLLSLETGEVLPKNIASLLSPMRNEAFFLPPYQLGEILRKSYGENFLSKFQYFDKKPMAAASIGQVHKCCLTSGKNNILKIQYPGIKDSIDSDIKNLSFILKASRLIPTSIDIDKLLEAGKNQLHNETDYVNEAKNQKLFSKLLRSDKAFQVPKVNDELSRTNIIAMEYKAGITIDKLDSFNQEIRDRIISSLCSLVFKEVFEFKLIQTDPNYANFLYNDKNRKIILLDFGATSVVKQKISELFQKILSETLFGNKKSVLKALMQGGLISQQIPNELIAKIINIYWKASKPIRENEYFYFRKSSVLEDMQSLGFDLFSNKEILELPDPEILFIQRKIGGIFMLGRHLSAKVNLKKILKPYI